MKVIVEEKIPENELNDQQLIERLKATIADRYQAWDEYIKARDLKPRIDAKEFYRRFYDARPIIHTNKEEIDFIPDFMSIATEGVYFMCTEIKGNEVTGFMYFGFIRYGDKPNSRIIRGSFKCDAIKPIPKEIP
jgi:hypothetical protein